MKFFILLLIIASFLQASFIPVNLVLLLLISRAFIIEDKSNYYLAFFAGLFLGIVSIYNIGLWPLIFLLLVKVINLSKKLPLSKNILSLIILSLGLIGLVGYSQSVMYHQFFDIKKVLV